VHSGRVILAEAVGSSTRTLHSQRAISAYQAQEG
jgi:hypothetical protein